MMNRMTELWHQAMIVIRMRAAAAAESGSKKAFFTWSKKAFFTCGTVEHRGLPELSRPALFPLLQAVSPAPSNNQRSAWIHVMMLMILYQLARNDVKRDCISALWGNVTANSIHTQENEPQGQWYALAATFRNA